MLTRKGSAGGYLTYLFINATNSKTKQMYRLLEYRPKLPSMQQLQELQCVGVVKTTTYIEQ